MISGYSTQPSCDEHQAPCVSNCTVAHYVDISTPSIRSWFQNAEALCCLLLELRFANSPSFSG